MFNAETLTDMLENQAKNLEVYTYESVTSTNDLAKEFAQKNPNKEAVIIASEQTAGRGRRGRAFFSPGKTGLYMSIVLRPAFSPELVSLLTPCAALCVADAIEQVSSKSTEIKWINDVYIKGKKVSGILCESSFTSGMNPLEYVIIGIGINLSTPILGFPSEIKNIATSVYGDNIPNALEIQTLCSSIINRICCYSSKLDKRDFLSAYKNKLCMIGCEIDVISQSQTYVAKAVDIDDNAHLIVALHNGEHVVLDAGEISIRKKEC